MEARKRVARNRQSIGITKSDLFNQDIHDLRQDIIEGERFGGESLEHKVICQYLPVSPAKFYPISRKVPSRRKQRSQTRCQLYPKLVTVRLHLWTTLYYSITVQACYHRFEIAFTIYKQ